MLDWDIVALRIARAYKVRVSDVKALLSMFPERVLAHSDCVVIFLRLTDESFKLLREGFYDISKSEHLFPLFAENGENIHFVAVVGCGASNILRFRDFFDGKTLSWFRPDMSRMVVFERR